MTSLNTDIQLSNAELFHQAADYALAAIAPVSEDDLDRPTPCTEWTVGQLLAHLVDVATALHKLADNGTLELVTQQQTETDLVDDVRDRMNALINRLTDAARTEPVCSPESEWVDNAAVSGAVEFTTHGWDISAALDQPHQIPDALAEPLVAITSSAIDNASRDPQFAPPVSVDPWQPASDQLLGFLGRDPGLTAI